MAGRRAALQNAAITKALGLGRPTLSESESKELRRKVWTPNPSIIAKLRGSKPRC
jgi:hypothetical protein